MIPQTFNDWRNCNVNDCKINLTKEFSAQRLAVCQNSQNIETQKFVSIYGELHLKNVVSWFSQMI